MSLRESQRCQGLSGLDQVRARSQPWSRLHSRLGLGRLALPSRVRLHFCQTTVLSILVSIRVFRLFDCFDCNDTVFFASKVNGIGVDRQARTIRHARDLQPRSVEPREQTGFTASFGVGCLFSCGSVEECHIRHRPPARRVRIPALLLLASRNALAPKGTPVVSTLWASVETWLIPLGYGERREKRLHTTCRLVPPLIG